MSSPSAIASARAPGLLWAARFLQRFILIFAVLALWLSLHAFFERKIEVRTGDAAWMWAEHPLASREPIVFAAVREFTPPADRVYAHVLVAAHPEYALYLNGVKVGAGESGRDAELDRYEVAPLLREGVNRLVVIARSKDGVGGVLASVDFGSDRRNAITTPSGWRVARNLEAAFTEPLARLERPRAFASPPFGPWNVPELQLTDTMRGEGEAVPPESISVTELSLPEIAVVSGVAVVRETRHAARVFDFGPVRGRIRFQRKDGSAIQVVPWRTANAESEIPLEAAAASAVFGQGEETYTSPAERSFRYVVVYDPDVSVSVYPAQG